MALRLLWLMLFVPAAAAQSVWYVDAASAPPGNGSASDPFPSIQQAVSEEATLDGDTLRIRPGTYQETVDLLGKSLTLHGEPGPAPVVVDAGGQGPVVRIAGATARLDGLTLRGGYGEFMGLERRGGGVLILDSIVVIEHCIVRDNRGSKGAGIHVRDSELTIRKTEVANNIGESDPGANLPGYGGGLLVANSTAWVEACSFRNNDGKINGGGVCAYFGAALHMADSVIEANRSLGFYDTVGNGICALSDAEVLLVRCTLTGNRSNGGSLSRGAGYFGPGRLESCRIEDNTAWTGAGVCGDTPDPDRLTLVDCVVTGNQGTVGGGASNARLEDCTLESNVAASAGGAAYASTLLGGVVRANRVGQPMLYPGAGAGLFQCDAVGVLIEDNLGVGNSGLARGAGICKGSAVRCVIRGNRFVVSATSLGGGAYGALLERCTLTGNSASSGGGMVDSIASSCIVWANLPDQVQGTDLVYSTIEGGAPGSGNLAGDPQFWLPLSADVHLKASSPCIDAGDPQLGLDSDGTPVDQGALPFNPDYCGPAASWCLATPSSNGCTPAIRSTGTPSLTGPDDFVLSAEPVRNQEIAWLLWSQAAGMTPFGGGALCLDGSISRSLPLATGGNQGPSDCSGRLEFAFSQSLMAALAYPSGTTLYAQFLHRDAGAGQAAGSSDALEFTLCP